MQLPAASRFLAWAALVTRISSQTVSAGSGPQRTSFAAAAFSTTMQCRVSLQNMIYNEDWRFMNDTASRWCRIRLENKMSTCCTNAEFAKGVADSCSDCQADCVHTKMTALCNAHFGKACKLKRQPFSKNNISMKVLETFCVPKDCDNSDDLSNNLLVKWFDAQYRYERPSLWMYDYSDAEDLECPTMMGVIVASVVAAIIVLIISIPLGIFLFKAPKERGRVLRGVDDDEDHQDTQVESMVALSNSE